MKTLEEMTQGFLALGISPEHAKLAAAKQYADALKEQEEAKAAAQAAADEAAGVDMWCGVRCSGISYLGKDENGNAIKIVSPGLTGAKALEDGIGLEPAKPGAKPKEGLPVFYPPKLWVFRKGSKPVSLSQSELVGLVAMIDKHGADKVLSLIREVASPAAVAAFEAAKKAGIDAGLYQDSNNKRNRRK